MENFIFIFGTGGHAKVIFDLIERSKLYTDIKFVSFEDNIGEFLGKTILSESAFLSNFNAVPIALAIGNNAQRNALFNKISDKQAGFSFPPLIHENAVIANDVTIGAGSVVMAGAVISTQVSIGDFAIINTNAVVDHDCEIGAFSHIAPNATICGGCTVGDGTLVGAGSTVIEGCSIGHNSIVAAGAAVIGSVPDLSLSKGVPAANSPIRSN